MSRTEPSILLVAGKLGFHDDGWSIRAFLDRLQARDCSAQVACVEAGGDAAGDPRVVECPGFAGRWRQTQAIRGLRRGERFERPDRIHVLQTRMVDAGLAIAEHWRVPYVQSIDEFVPAGQALRVSRRWCRRLLASSLELADDLISAYSVPQPLVTVVNPGIEASDDETITHRRGHVVAVIGTAGPLVASSGFATFLNAARRVLDAGIDAEFVIAGQGEDEVDLRRRADRLKISDRVTFAGIPVVGLRFWKVLDVYCQPSLAPTVGRTLATALAFGVPSIASDIEGLRALIQDGVNGYHVEPGESSGMARLILEILANPDEARELGRKGREVILRDFQPATEADNLVRIYREAVAQDTSAPSRTADLDASAIRFS